MVVLMVKVLVKSSEARMVRKTGEWWGERKARSKESRLVRELLGRVKKKERCLES